MKSVLIKDLLPYATEDFKIRARICRLWKGKRFSEGLHCVLVDEKADAIHGHALESDYEFVREKIKEGNVYNVSNFYVDQVPATYNVIDNPVELRFNRRTTFTPLQNSFPTIPQHRFSPLEYNQLETRINNHKILTDLFSCLRSTKEPIIKQGLSYRCEIYLENLRREQIKVTLWDDVAMSVIETTRNLSPPVLLMVTSLRISEYNGQTTQTATDHTCVFINPDISQADAYKKEFSKAATITRTSANPQIQITTEEVKQQTKVTVHQLNKLDPKQYKDRMIYCKGSICRYSPNINWWYEACPRCYKQLNTKENSDLRICLDHGMQVPLPCYRLRVTIEDPNNEASLKLRGKQAEQLFGITCKDLINKYSYTAEQSLPYEILSTIGQIHTFQVQITDRHELIIKGLFESTSSTEGEVEYDSTMFTSTPICYEKRHTSDRNRKDLFGDQIKKKPRSEHDDTVSTPSPQTPRAQGKMKTKED